MQSEFASRKLSQVILAFLEIIYAYFSFLAASFQIKCFSFFLCSEIVEEKKANIGPEDHFVRNIRKARQEIRDEPLRIFSAEHLQKLAGIGPSIARVTTLCTLVIWCSIVMGKAKKYDILFLYPVQYSVLWLLICSL